MIREWMNPLNKLVWIKAFRAKAAIVKLSDGQIFNLDYKTRPGFVWVSPVKGAGYCPCGWFDLDKVIRSEWVED